MTKFAQFSWGIKSYSAAFRFIFEHKMAQFFLFPVVLMILLFIGGQTAINQWIDVLKEGVLSWVNADQFNFWGGGFLATAISASVQILVEVTFFLAFWYLGGYVVIIVLSPVLSYISEKTENILTGNDYPFDLKQMIADIFRGILIALRNMLIELGLLILTFFVGLIPVIGWFAAIFMFIISTYFYGFSFMDLNNERKRLSVDQSVQLVRRNRWTAIGLGFIYSLSLLIPFCGMFLSLFVVIVGTVAATLVMNDERFDWGKFGE